MTSALTSEDDRLIGGKMTKEQEDSRRISLDTLTYKCENLELCEHSYELQGNKKRCEL